jgi:hypothetical protein
MVTDFRKVTSGLSEIVGNKKAELLDRINAAKKLIELIEKDGIASFRTWNTQIYNEVKRILLSFVEDFKSVILRRYPLYEKLNF